ncbi:hypothetical protein WA158_006381 [Blastocystis sp. Blastoise]
MNPPDYPQNIPNQYVNVYDYPPPLQQNPMVQKNNMGQINMMQPDIDMYGNQPSKRIAKLGQWRTPPQVQYINPNSIRKPNQMNPMQGMPRPMAYGDPNYSIFPLQARNTYQGNPKDLMQPHFQVPAPRNDWAGSMPLFAQPADGQNSYKRNTSQPMMNSYQKWTMPNSNSLPSNPSNPIPGVNLVNSMPDQSNTGKSVIDTPQLLEMYEKLQDEYLKKQKRLARNRAAARLRRLRKKTQVETMEMKIEHLKNAVKAITNFEWTDERTGIYNVISHYSGFILTRKEREDEYEFLLSLWKNSYEYQLKFLTIYSSLIAAYLPENEDTKVPQLVSLKTSMNLSPEQFQDILELVPKLNELRKKLIISKYIIELLATHNNILVMNPYVDQTNELFNSVLSYVQIAELMSLLNTNRDVVEQLPYQAAQLPSDINDLPAGLQFDFDPK